MDNKRIDQLVEIKLKKTHAMIVALIALGTPPLTAYSSYVKAMADAQVRFAEFQLDAEKTYVKRVEMAAMTEKIDSLSKNVAWVKGYLQHQGRMRGQQIDNFSLRDAAPGSTLRSKGEENS